MASHKAENDIPNLAVKGATLFRGTGKGQAKSRVTIRILGHNLKSRSYSPVPHNKKARFKIPGIEPNQTFKSIINMEEQ